MQALIERCCGLDVHQETVVACLLIGAAGARARAPDRAGREARPVINRASPAACLPEEEAMKLLHAYAPVGDQMAGEPEELGAFAAASIIHDLGNLIQIASSALNIVARTPNMPAIHAGPMLDRAKICLEHAGALVHQNIGLIRNRMIADERSSVGKLLSDVATLVEAMGESGLVLDLDVEPNLPKIQCDTIGFRRAVLNLVFNARDAIDGHGIVRIEARTMPVAKLWSVPKRAWGRRAIAERARRFAADPPLQCRR